MRPVLILGAAVSALAALALTIQLSDHGPRSEDPPKEVVVSRDGQAPDIRPDPAATSPDAELAPLETPTGGAAAASAPTAIPKVIHAVDLQMSPFRGSALIQREGQPVASVRLGTLSFEILLRGRREAVELSVVNGRFETEIPSIARILLTTGVFDGETVRFPGLEAPFDPTEAEQAIVGAPFPRNVLRVVDGGQRSALTDVTIRKADTSTAALLAGQADTGALVLEHATAPIVLPWIRAAGPTWLRVSAPGYAATNVLVDPTRASEKEVELWPSADLTVRISGPGRKRLRAIVLFLEGTTGRRSTTAIFARNMPGVIEDTDSITFPIVGVPGAPHRIIAKGYDGRGRTVDLGEKRVEIGANEAKDVELHING